MAEMIIKKVTTAMKMQEEEEEEQQPASPATRLFHSPGMDCFIIALIGCKKKVTDVQALGEEIVNTLSNIPRFSSVLVKDEKTGKMSWRSTEPKTNEHIFCPGLDYEMDGADEFVEQYIHRLTSRPMDLTRPLWEFHILNVKTSDANSVGIFKIHHSVGDGITLISTILACTRKSSDPDSLPTIPGGSKPKSSKPTSPIKRFFTAIWMLLLLCFNTMMDVALFVATLLFLEDTETPIKGKPGIELTHKHIARRAFKLNDIKLLKNAMNVTINDVIVGITEAGLSRYLNRRYAGGNQNGHHRASEKTNSLPKNIRMRISLIFNIRPYAGLQVLADMMKKKSKAKWGNLVGYSLLPLTVALRDDPLTHIVEAHSTINRKKLSLESRFSYAVIELLVSLLGEKVASFITNRVLSNTTVCLSNVVGPQEEVSFLGYPISYIAPSVHGLPFALLIHYQSYVDEIAVTITYDPDLILDPQMLCEDIEESLNLMKRTAIERGLIAQAAAC